MAFDVDESFLVAAEQALGAQLPASYKEAMRRSNGGELEAAGDVWQLHPVADTSDCKRLSRSANHILKETEIYRGWTGFPPNALAIASNSCGDALVFLWDGGAFGNPVFRWAHETRQLEEVATDFADLHRC